MRHAVFPVVAGGLAITAPARAETPDCATFPGDRAKFACYDNVSRAPRPEAAKPGAKAKPVTNSRKAGRDN
jgi:hypothetical protein